jgi:threonylcarbamoyladenosine tRNA methylthiotransferase MtaB
MVRFQLHNFGCRTNQAEGAALRQQLRDTGLEEVARFTPSQVAILNTCTVTATADAEVRQVIRRIHRANPECQILVTGCYAQRTAQEIARLPGVAWVVGNSHKHTIAELLKSRLNLDGDSGRRAINPTGAGTDFIDSLDTVDVRVGELATGFDFSPAFADDRTRPTLKIQDGCNARCSFCIVPQVRGRSRSLIADAVVAHVRGLAARGYLEVVLSGINLGGYGRDLQPRTTLLAMTERILAETSIARLRISSLEVTDLSPEMIRLFAGAPRLAQHFHVPLQSGSDGILQRMRRPYRAAQYAECILAIRQEIPNCGLGADVMVGFPGETEEDHTTSLRFIESLPFTYLHIFPYSARPGTPAATLPAQINGRVVRERCQQLRSLMKEKRQAFLAAQVGRQLSVLSLDDAEDGARLALSSNYLKVALRGPDPGPNRLLDVRIERVAGDLLCGTAV